MSPEKTGTTIIYRLNVSVLEEALRALMDAFKATGASSNPVVHGITSTGSGTVQLCPITQTR